MCIAILKTKEGILTDDMLKESFKSNGNGAGIAYCKDGHLYIKKGIFSAEQLIELVREAEKECDGNILIHCRIGTSGLKDANNTHPFVVINTPTEAVCLAHNGILDIDVPKDSKINDTQIFIQEYLSTLNRDMLMNHEGIGKMIGELIGSSNKFVLMDNYNNYRIINEDSGHWKDGVWFSNYSYQKSNWFGYSHYDSRYNYYNQTMYGDFSSEDEYDTNYRLRGYGKYAQTISENEYDKILTTIDKMEDRDFANVGYYPMYDFASNTIEPYDYRFDDNQFNTKVPLEDLSCELYDYFLERCEGAEELYEYDDDGNEELTEIERANS